jgi:hypothetical protein
MTQDEIWKPVYIKDEKTQYEVSNKGRARNAEKDKMLNPLLNISNGYYRYDIRRNKGDKSNLILAHRLVLSSFSPIENPEEYTVHHKDGIKTNNRLENLQWLTLRDHTLLEMDLGNNKISKRREEAINFKGYIGEFLKDGTLINFYAGRKDIERNNKSQASVYGVTINQGESYRNLIYRRFPIGTKPEIGKKYDLYDNIFTQFFKHRLDKIPTNSKIQLEFSL